jgi:hypothetical protein
MRQDGSSAALPGAVHDLTAARTHTIIEALTSANVMTFVDKQHPDTVQTPPLPAETLRLVEEGQPGLRPDPSHRGTRNAILKTWKILTKLRCSPRRGDRDRAGHPTSRTQPTQDEKGSLLVRFPWTAKKIGAAVKVPAGVAMLARLAWRKVFGSGCSPGSLRCGITAGHGGDQVV